MRPRRPLLISTVVALLLVSCAPTETVSTTSTSVDLAGPTPVILDGDFGPDDMMALFYLLQRPDLEVLAVTVSGTGLVHCPQGAANAAAILVHLDRTDIPVACGPDEPTAGGNAFPEVWRAGSDELATSLGVEPYTGDVDTDAVGLLTDLDGNPDTSVFVEVVNESEEPVAVMAGAHDGVSWEQLEADARVYEETLTPPEYWVQVGTVGIAGHSVTGGATVGSLELEPGTYAIACGTAANDVILLTDIVISP